MGSQIIQKPRNYKYVLKTFGFREQSSFCNSDVFCCLCRLEDLVEKQRAELAELRQQTGSANTSSTSGRGSVTPENARDSTSTPQATYTPSSGRGTGICSRGTDPLFEWPERSSASTCTRATSPLVFGDIPKMTSPVESPENLTNQEAVEKNGDIVDVVSIERFMKIEVRKSVLGGGGRYSL